MDRNQTEGKLRKKLIMTDSTQQHLDQVRFSSDLG